MPDSPPSNPIQRSARSTDSEMSVEHGRATISALNRSFSPIHSPQSRLSSRSTPSARSDGSARLLRPNFDFDGDGDTAMLPPLPEWDAERSCESSFNSSDMSAPDINLSFDIPLEAGLGLEDLAELENAVANQVLERDFTPDGFHPNWYLGWYHGLFSRPRCLASSQPYQPRSSWDGYPHRARLLVPLLSHPVLPMWEATIAPAVADLADKLVIPWTSIFIVRISRLENEFFVEAADAQARHVVMVGVGQAHLSLNHTHRFVTEAKFALEAFALDDIDVEVCTLDTRPLAQPELITSHLGSTIREYELPLAAGIGLELAPLSKPMRRGTGCVFLTLGSLPGLYLLTCQHCLMDERLAGRGFHDKSPGEQVTLMGAAGYDERVRALSNAIESLQSQVDVRRRLVLIANSERTHSAAELELVRIISTLASLEALSGTLQTDWEDETSRIIGRVSCYEPIDVRIGSFARFQPANHPPNTDGGYTTDWGLIEVRHDLFGERPNVLPLNLDHVTLFGSSSSFPLDGNLTITGFSPLTAFHATPTIVLKRGAKTGITVGRTSPLRSLVRERKNMAGAASAFGPRAWELPIFGDPDRTVPFSDSGDSGAAVVDCNRRVLAMITRGMKGEEPGEKGCDVTLATPIEYLLERIRTISGLDPAIA